MSIKEYCIALDKAINARIKELHQNIVTGGNENDLKELFYIQNKPFEWFKNHLKKRKVKIK